MQVKLYVRVNSAAIDDQAACLRGVPPELPCDGRRLWVFFYFLPKKCPIYKVRACCQNDSKLPDELPGLRLAGRRFDNCHSRACKLFRFIEPPDEWDAFGNIRTPHQYLTRP